MKKLPVFLIAFLCAITTSIAKTTALLPEPENTFIGTWTMDVVGGGVAWLKVHEEQGVLDGELLWIGGSTLPISDVYLVDENTLIVTRTSDKKLKTTSGKERTHTRTWTMRITKKNDEVAGTMTGPAWGSTGEEISYFTGTRMPAVGPAPDLKALKYGKSIKLFNGKDLTGWRTIDPKSPNGFKVVNGTMQNDPVQPENGEHIYYGNLRTDQEFEDFNLKLEVNVPKGNNSGIYLKGLYEIQVVDSYGLELDSHNMGALYSRVTPSENAEKPAGEWQTLDITLVDRHVTVVLNGKKIIDNAAVEGPTGGAISSDVFAPGPIYLQGDHGNVAYKNIVLTPVQK
ncbi:hypothetical protein LCGC14_0071420 [marine sediment metagenome]|uniref:3-keto-alpha-glucoside-1,2-lyase/3-keto-2-hydroxy-glucal hydratase domain-containing protein n=1 Tax=marine sediment metagenome TaxID=412755 RepID=A0A0F9YNB2_9ZZZZ|nr:DUF1080 domain-containing protein [Maribacter sp.]HDZ05492.1 DUF1080 domain-containing protein [Maribacter sp.]HEA78932.1 DUF1080 domain-containing protein [Maribacter sp.]